MVGMPAASLCRDWGIAGSNICKHLNKFTINLKVCSKFSAGVFNNETAVHTGNCSRHALIYMNNRRGLVWPMCRITCLSVEK